MSLRKVVEQDPEENLPYRVTVEGDTISTAEWEISPAGPSVSPVTPIPADHTDCFVQGVTADVTYELRCKVTTAGGGRFVRAVTIQGVDK